MKKIALCTVLLAAGLAFLASDTGTWKCLRLIQPEYLERGSPELDALYERRALDGQNVLVPIPPARALELLATGDENWRLPVRARLLEQTGRLEEAEAAWRHWNERTGPSAEGVTCLAAFYRRHAMARQELELLERSTALLVGGKKAPLGLAEVWNRIMSLAVPAGLKPAEQDALHRRHIAAFAEHAEHAAVFQSWLEALLDDSRWDTLAAALGEYRQAFPDNRDAVTAFQARALAARGEAAGVRALFEKEFHPLMESEAARHLFRAMEKAKLWPDMLREAEARLRRDPLDAGAVYRLYHSQMFRDNLSGAASILRDYRLVRNARLGAAAPAEAWRCEELAVMGILAHRCRDDAEALRYFHSFYLVSPAGQPVRVSGVPLALVREEALQAAYRMLVAPESGVDGYTAQSLGGLATLVNADANPGFLNGVLSILLNGVDPGSELQELERAGEPYFLARRAEAVVAELKPGLAPDDYVRYRAGLAPLYLRTGDRAGALSLLEGLAQEARDPDLRRGLWLQAAETAAEGGDTAAATVERCYRQAVAVEGQSQPVAPLGASSLEYWTVGDGAPRRNRWQALDALTNFLTSRRRLLDAVAVYRRLIDAHPQDEQLYEKLAALLESGKLPAEQEALYRRATEQFEGPGWFNRLARFYLRAKRTQEFQQLTARLVQTFAGSSLESYFSSVLPQASGLMGEKPYRRYALEVATAALERFPLNRRFQSEAMRLANFVDAGRYRQLVATYFMLSTEARDRYFQDLTVRNLLDGALATEPSGDDPLWIYLGAEANIWRCRFETATPLYQRLVELYPGDDTIARRAAELLRSGGVQDPARYAQAADLLADLGRRTGRQGEMLVEAGDCLALGGDVAGGARRWRQVLTLYPDDPDQWLNVATVFWDYYLFDEARSVIREIRQRKDDPNLFPFEMGVLLEEDGQTGAAMIEYLKLALTWGERHWEARARLNQLLQREENRRLFTQAVTDRLRSGPKPVEFLNNLRNFLQEWNLSDKFPLPEWAASLVAESAGADTIREALGQLSDLLSADDRMRGYRLLVRLAPPGADRLSASFAWIQQLVDDGRGQEADRALAELVREHPVNLGVIRRSVDAYVSLDRRNQAAGILRGVLPRAVAPYRREFTERLIRVLADDRKPLEAAAVAADWLRAEPDDLAVMELRWAALSAAGQPVVAIPEIRQTLGRLQSLVPDPAVRKARAVDLRNRVAAAAWDAGDRVQAVDEYYEILKLAPEDRGVLEQAVLAAQQADQLSRLEGYFRKAATDSPSDYRWPLVLARLEMLRDNPKAATARYAQCLKVVPQRTDLGAEALRPLEILGDWRAMKDRCLELARLNYNDPGWLQDAATAAWRAGLEGEARDLARQYAQAYSGVPRIQAMAEMLLYSDWHRNDWAVDMILKFLQTAKPDEALAWDLDSNNLMTIAANSSRMPQLTERLLAIVDGAVRQNEIERAAAWLSLAGAGLKEPLPAETRQAVVRQFQTRLGGYLNGPLKNRALEALIRPAEQGVITELLGPLYQGKVRSDKGSYIPWRIREYLYARGMWAELSALNDLLLSRIDPGDWDHRRLRAEQAWLEMLQAKTPTELERLRRIYQDPEHEPGVEEAWRYFELLFRQGGLAELGAGFGGVQWHKGTFVEFLAAKQDYALAAKSLQTVFADQSPVWRDAHTALLAGCPGSELAADKPFSRVLRLVPVRDLLESVAEDDTALMPPHWYRYAARYGDWLLASGKTEPGAAWAVADLERNNHRRVEYEVLFERMLARGRVAEARQCLQWLTALDERPLKDAWNRLRLAAAGKDAGAVTTAYGRLLDLLAADDGAGFLASDGLELVGIGRRFAVLVRFRDVWPKVMIRQHALEEYGPFGDTLMGLLFALPPAERWAVIEGCVRGHQRPVEALKYFLTRNFAVVDADGRLAALAAELASEESVLGREARLAALARKWGAAGPPIQTGDNPSVQRATLCGDETLSQTVGQLTPADWRRWWTWLNSQKPAGGPPPAEAFQTWIESQPAGTTSWSELNDRFLRAFGWNVRAAELTRELVLSAIRDRYPTAEEAFQLAVLDAERGDAAGMAARFREALNRAEDRLDMARRITAFLVEHDRFDQVEPFLAVFEGLGRGSPATDGYRLRMQFAADYRQVTLARLLAYLDRPDVPLERKTETIETVIRYGLKDRSWAAELAGGVPVTPPATGWSEVRRLLALRLHALQFGAPAAFPAAEADLADHPDARLLVRWLAERAESAGNTALLAKYLPMLFRTRSESEPVLPLLQKAVPSGLERTAITLINQEALNYEHLMARDNPSSGNDVGSGLAEFLSRESRGPGDLVVIENMLDRLNLRGALENVWLRALAWRYDAAMRQGLADRLFVLLEDKARQRRVWDARFQLDHQLSN